MVDVELISAPVVDWEQFLKASAPAVYHPAKGVDCVRTKNNPVFNLLIGITTINNLREGSTGKPSRKSLKHCSFSFVVHAPAEFFSELESNLKMQAVTVQRSNEAGHFIGVITGDLHQFRMLTFFFGVPYGPVCIEVANLILLKFEQIGFAALWSDYRKVPHGNNLFTLEAI